MTKSTDRIDFPLVDFDLMEAHITTKNPVVCPVRLDKASGCFSTKAYPNSENETWEPRRAAKMYGTKCFQHEI